MAKPYSDAFKANINAVAETEAPLVLLEITHPGLAEPVRVVNDNQDIVSRGFRFVALAFQIVLPDDLEEGLPKATLAVDNVGRELTQWIEESRGGAGATVRIMQVLRSQPDVIEWDVTLDLSNVRMDAATVQGTLSYEDLLNRPAVTLFYRPETAPGVF